jgi:hypothetical protein
MRRSGSRAVTFEDNPPAGLKLRTLTILLCAIFVYSQSSADASFDVAAFVDNMKDHNDQTVLTGNIDGKIINRGGVEFNFGPGTVTLFDFGADRPCALVYEGSGTFFYAPPDEVERGQLFKFANTGLLNVGFKKAVFFYTVEFYNPFDTSAFTRKVADKGTWNDLRSAVKDAFDHLGIHMPNKLLGDLLAGVPGTYFYADFDADKSGHLVFREDPAKDDQYTLFQLIRRGSSDSYDTIGGFSTDNLLPSQRGLSPIDIRHYTIESNISQSGKMMVKCRIEYAPARGGYPFLYFGWYYRNKIKSILDSTGDTLTYVNRKDEWGFGVVLNKMPNFGETDYIDIFYDCKSLADVYGVFYVKAKTYWYPHNPIRDIATFELIYDRPKELEIISCGNFIENIEEGGRGICRWKVDQPVEYISFNIGVFETREFKVENLAPVKVYLLESVDHTRWALLLAYFGELSQADMLGAVGADVTNSLAFYTSILGPCPFDTIRATEIYTVGSGQGSPGFIHLSWDTFQMDDIKGWDETFRAHEVAHQWWGHMVDYESYKDVWITEGLANFCGLWFYELSSKNRDAVKNMLGVWRKASIEGLSVYSVGSKAGPIILGYRLSSSKSSDYNNIVYRKGGYILSSRGK